MSDGPGPIRLLIDAGTTPLSEISGGFPKPRYVENPTAQESLESGTELATNVPASS